MERESSGKVAPEFLPKWIDSRSEFEEDYDRKRAGIERALGEYESPFYLYDELGIRQTVRNLKSKFDWAPEYQEYFAVKALPNPEILKILAEEGCGADASSGPEVLLAEAAGIHGESIMFTSNDTSAEEFRLATEAGAVINFDDITHLSYYRDNVGKFPELVCLRYQPNSRDFQGNDIIGTDKPKFGMEEHQISEALHYLKKHGVKRFGLHTMPVSNELTAGNLTRAGRLFIETAAHLSREHNIKFDLLNFGGGYGIPYRADQDRLDLDRVQQGLRNAYEDEISYAGLGRPKVSMELGRYITGPHGVLVTEVRHVMQKAGRPIAGVDATMADLMRPGMYGAYHFISVIGKEGEPGVFTYDVVGSLCEGNDKFAVDRHLPPLSPEDVLVIHDAGAHARAMGFNYNGKMRCGELLLRRDGSIQEIRRAETPSDYFATLPDDWREALQAAQDRLEKSTKE